VSNFFFLIAALGFLLLLILVPFGLARLHVLLCLAAWRSDLKQKTAAFHPEKIFFFKQMTMCDPVFTMEKKKEDPNCNCSDIQTLWSTPSARGQA
jgi:hypothetical protein